MKNIQVTLTADTPSMERKVLAILRREQWISILQYREARQWSQCRADLDAAVMAFEKPASPERWFSAINALSAGGIPVICIAQTEEHCRRLRALKGCSVILYADGQSPHGEELFEKELLVKIKSCYGSGGGRRKVPERGLSRCLVGIGASTGGPRALTAVLKDLPADTCAVLVVQHMCSGFTGNFTQYLSEKCRMRVKQAEPEEVILDGTVYLAPEGCQMRAAGRNGEFVLLLSRDRGGYDFFPSVDCLLESVADCAGKRAMGIILTGMGADGARGILKMRRMGAYTVGQNRETSDIYSMPYEADRLGGVMKQLPLEAIAGELELFSRRMKNK